VRNGVRPGAPTFAARAARRPWTNAVRGAWAYYKLARALCPAGGPGLFEPGLR
jgi:hypothetical protein